MSPPVFPAPSFPSVPPVPPFVPPALSPPVPPPAATPAGEVIFDAAARRATAQTASGAARFFAPFAQWAGGARLAAALTTAEALSIVGLLVYGTYKFFDETAGKVPPGAWRHFNGLTPVAPGYGLSVLDGMYATIRLPDRLPRYAPTPSAPAQKAPSGPFPSSLQVPIAEKREIAILPPPNPSSPPIREKDSKEVSSLELASPGEQLSWWQKLWRYFSGEKGLSRGGIDPNAPPNSLYAPRKRYSPQDQKIPTHREILTEAIKEYYQTGDGKSLQWLTYQLALLMEKTAKILGSEINWHAHPFSQRDVRNSIEQIFQEYERIRSVHPSWGSRYHQIHGVVPLPGGERGVFLVILIQRDGSVRLNGLHLPSTIRVHSGTDPIARALDMPVRNSSSP